QADSWPAGPMKASGSIWSAPAFNLAAAASIRFSSPPRLRWSAKARSPPSPMCIMSCKERLSRLHCDESGSISVATVFALLFLTMVGERVIKGEGQVDNKVKLQPAADASTYSGGVVLARSMNTLAFTNHMLCEVFALTAILREARDRHSDPLVSEVLAAWDTI